MDQNSFSVLIFEDDLDQQHIMGKVLEKQGFRAKFVSSSDLGLEVLKKERFDAILMDYKLAPGSQDGIETLKEIRKKDLSIPWKHICKMDSNNWSW